VRDRLDRINAALGRLVFRGLGTLCAIAALASTYGIWWQVTHWNADSPIVIAMFAVAALGAGIAVPYCFSRTRTFTEVLDAMEGDGDVAPPRLPQ
jgi:hypothetical protein